MSSSNITITMREEQAGEPINYNNPALGNSIDFSVWVIIRTTIRITLSLRIRIRMGIAITITIIIRKRIRINITLKIRIRK